MRLSFLLVGVGLIIGCKAGPVEVAPEGLDSNVKWFWVNGDSADDATMLDAAAKLGVAGKADSRTTPLKGPHREALTPQDLAPVMLEQNDPSTTRGLLMVNTFNCTLEKLASILSDPEQTNLYPRVWDRHARTLTADRDAFLEGRLAKVAWDADIDITFPIDDRYTSKWKGSVRRLKATPASGLPSDVLVARTWLTAPATFASSSSSYLKQNYEMEVFWEQSPGRIFHAYGMWREVRVAAFNVTLNDSSFFNIVLDNLADWDAKTAAICAK